MPINRLADSCLNAAGVDDQEQAIAILSEDVLCRQCEQEDAELYGVLGEFLGLTEVERFEFSGLTIDPARLQAYRLSY
jgi:hypothetical protein